MNLWKIKKHITLNLEKFCDTELIEDLDYISFLYDRVVLSFRDEATVFEYFYRDIEVLEIN